MLFPSIDPLASLSDSLTDEFVGRRHVEIAQRAKQAFDAYARLDPNFDLFGSDRKEAGEGVVRAHRLLGYFRQPFLVAEPFSGHPGVSVGQTELLDAVEAILDQ
jgi:F0F1-type ATP synthase beta subunit